MKTGVAAAVLAAFVVTDTENEYNPETFTSAKRAQAWINAQLADDEELDQDRFEITETTIDSALDADELAAADQMADDDVENMSAGVEEEELENA